MYVCDILCYNVTYVSKKFTFLCEIVNLYIRIGYALNKKVLIDKKGVICQMVSFDIKLCIVCKHFC